MGAELSNQDNKTKLWNHTEANMAHIEPTSEKEGMLSHIDVIYVSRLINILFENHSDEVGFL